MSVGWRGPFSLMLVISRHCPPLVSSCAAAGIPGGQEEAVHQSSSAGQAEEQHRAGQGFVSHRQRSGAHDPGCPGRHGRGQQHGEPSFPSQGLFLGSPEKTLPFSGIGGILVHVCVGDMWTGVAHAHTL